MLNFLMILPSWLRLALGAAALLAAATAYDALIDDPAVRRAALAGFVAQAELSAAQAQIAEISRQKAAADASLAEFSERLRVAERAALAANDALEAAIAAHADVLAKEGRSCPLTDADIRFLRGQ